jgi:hypothetical protein
MMETPTGHPFDFVLAIMGRLAQARIATWLNGGWAEELWGMCSPRPHRDVDLLYPAPDFARLDQWLAQTADLVAIPAKQFSHKRAFLSERIMIEVVLLEPEQKGGYRTNFFNRRYQLVWPHHTLRLLSVRNQEVPVASDEALRLYRHHHHHILKAYQMYCQGQV